MMDEFYSRTFEDIESVKKYSKAQTCIKRDGSKVALDVNKIKARLESLLLDLDPKFINMNVIVYRVVQGLYENIPTQEIDDLVAEACAYMNIIHPSYSLLAARITVSNLHKSTNPSFVETIKALYHYEENGKNSALIQKEVYDIVMANQERIEKEIDHSRDLTYDFFGFKTIEKSYLLKMSNKVVERPQYMLMRVSLGIHKHDLDSVFETYHLMSQKWFTHATPTLFNSGTNRP